MLATLTLVLALTLSDADAERLQRHRTGSSLSGPVAADRHGSPVKPTIVFVHGAFADASGFADSITTLQRAGYPVLAPANPLRGLSGDADSLRTFLSTLTGPIVLVGHSYGGAVITNAATGNPNVKALVYIAAYALDAGESVSDANSLGGGTSDLLDNIYLRPIPGFDPVPPPKGNLDAYIKVEIVPGRLRRRRPQGHRCRDGRYPTTRCPHLARRTIGSTRLENHPVLVPGRQPGQGHPTGGRTGDGSTGQRQDRRDPQFPRGDGQSPRAVTALILAAVAARDRPRQHHFLAKHERRRRQELEQPVWPLALAVLTLSWTGRPLMWMSVPRGDFAKVLQDVQRNCRPGVTRQWCGRRLTRAQGGTGDVDPGY